MTRHRRQAAFRRISNERGFTLAYMAVILTGLCLFTGLAVDSGRGYVVKAQLTKAVDGAALGAARALNSGDPRAEAVRIFRANFPPGYMGTLTSPDPTAAGNFFSLRTDEANGVNIVTVQAEAVLPTTFIRLANLDEMRVNSMGEATRRMVDLSLILDVSSSIGSRWGAVRDAARAFVNGFSATSDRMSLVFFSNGARVVDQMRSARGFDKPRLISDIPNSLPGGSTLMVEGLYRGWDELRTVPSGSQSGLRVVVLFTDGASNGVPGFYEPSPGTARALRTYDFPDHPPDPDGQTHDNPHITGLYDTETGSASPSYDITVPDWRNNCTQPNSCLTAVPYLPIGNRTAHTHRRSVGIPTSFPFVSNTLLVDGMRQDLARPLRNPTAGRWPADVTNINNTARNVLEIIANDVRNDNGDYRIRIYTIGMGELVRYRLGTRRETSESILMRISNDARSPEFNNAQLEGKYYFAATEADVGPAFQALQNQIIRLSK
jgi:Flp pilus assembly protein TadG